MKKKKTKVILWKEGLLIINGDTKLTGYSSFFYRDHLKLKWEMKCGGQKGSVINPTLFNIMINDIYNIIDLGIGADLYADDCTLKQKKYWIYNRSSSKINNRWKDGP